MKLFGPLSQAVVIAGVMMSATAMPALAGPADIALLKSYLGTYEGRGTLTGAQAQPVTCKMQLSSGNSDKVNYTGRCSLANTQLSVTGTIAYIDAKKRYEAVMNTGIGGFRGVAVGQKSGSGIVFDLKQRADDEAGNDITIASRIVLSGGTIGVDFHAVFNKTGDTLDAKIPFSKL
jgi:hypothetical protein